MYIQTISALEQEIGKTQEDQPIGYFGSLGQTLRVRYFTCSSSDLTQVAGIVGRPVTAQELRTAVDDAAGQSVTWISNAAAALEVSPRSGRTSERFFHAFATMPGTVPAWRPAGASWADFGRLVALRLRKVANIINGGWIKYFCWGSSTHCPECTGNPATYFACSSFLGKYLICLGDGFWQAWRNGDTATMASTLLHEALHIYFRRTVSDSGSTGNANCYERYVFRFNELYLHPATAAACPINLHRGPFSLPVRELQRRLNAWITATPGTGLAQLRVDGLFEDRTEAALRKFQSAMGLPGDGVAGAQTWARLPQRPGSTLRRGAQGLDVRELQIKLNMWLGTVHGSSQLKVDQIFGKSTEAAVRAFQKAHGLKVDGIAGPLTWAQLPPF